jgi:hypothetical protein
LDTPGPEAGNDEEEKRQENVFSDQNFCTTDSIFADCVFVDCLSDPKHGLGKIEGDLLDPKLSKQQLPNQTSGAFKFLCELSRNHQFLF